MRKYLMAAAVGFGSLASAFPAQASIILSSLGTPVAVTSGGAVKGYDYTYNVTLSSDEQLDTSVQPVFFTLYDFGAATFEGATGDLATAGAWSHVLNKNQTTYAQGVLPNNTSLDDVRFSYSGPQLLGTSLANTQGNLGTFTLFTTSTGPYAIFNDNQDAQLEKLAPGTPTNDTDASNIDSVAVPTLGRVVGVPEPASLTLLGAGLVGMAIKRRRRTAA